ncbi:hypothetical protein HMPREF0971_01028 [Segatella oris F0302]|uniref:MORN repeat protein n=1 Tax=Segatella oris F0302 TaxID=649760 RepID=D1QPY1_9BACT|nr:hypothetical protein [Segatella oris]EFB32575.1 hypothetical protein HMPREF0971_01028 [Segatella oris F0302]
MIKFIILIMSILLTACVAPTPKKNASKKSNQMVYLEKLDTADANKRILEYRKKEEAENPDEQFMDSASYCEYTDSVGYVVYIGKNDDGYLKTKRRKESLFGEYRYYFLNGNLQQLGEYYSRDFECGIWKEYDIEGHLLKEVNKDEPYKQFSWQKVLLFTKKKDIDLNDERTYVGRYIDESNIPCWDISWHKKGEGFGRNVVIDARNGRIINETISCMEK